METSFKSKFIDSEILELYQLTLKFRPSLIKKEWINRNEFLSYIVTQPHITQSLLEKEPSSIFHIIKHIANRETKPLREINVDLAEKIWEIVRYVPTTDLIKQPQLFKHINKEAPLLKYLILQENFRHHVPQRFENLENILLTSYYINLFYKNKTKLEVTYVPDPKHFELLNHLLKIPEEQRNCFHMSNIFFRGEQTTMTTELEKFKQFCIMACQVKEFNFNLLAWYFIFCQNEIIEQQSFLYALLDIKWEYIPIIIQVLKAANIPISHVTPKEWLSLSEYISENENDLSNLTGDGLFTVFNGIFLQKNRITGPITFFADPNFQTYLKYENYAKFLAVNPFMLGEIKNLNMFELPSSVDAKSLNSYNVFSLDDNSNVECFYDPTTPSPLLQTHSRLDILTRTPDILDKSLLLYQFIQAFGTMGIYFNPTLNFDENIKNNRLSINYYVKMYLHLYPQREMVLRDFLEKHNYLDKI
ncbi:hypothetical protein DLEV_043 [Diachasmimorpha longicaudata entomopoxvirus]|uniref:Uncharacterized protein n=1 Tax=Diachasmimorpha longicaudata entomopoxvirus TaxID=109981 RepID=A0A7R5WMD2_9POXV|nr:hypothetical protein QKK69_gp043 [Diachasmimorpha longicaudata entomopoxvirus]AKS26334.1 hypothetical protein DLEV_043 [Diachasmimorpha longicaudata entomopoxvirus]